MWAEVHNGTPIEIHMPIPFLLKNTYFYFVCIKLFVTDWLSEFLTALCSRTNKFLKIKVPYILEKIKFPDHYNYSIEDLEKLKFMANELDAILIPTKKDYFRINMFNLEKR